MTCSASASTLPLLQKRSNKEGFLKTKSPALRGAFCLEDYERLMRAERRDLVRDALFFLITPRFAALSIAEYASLRDASAPSLFLSSAIFFTFLTASAMARSRRILTTRRRFPARSCFFADAVIGIVRKPYQKSPCKATSGMLPP